MITFASIPGEIYSAVAGNTALLTIVVLAGVLVYIGQKSLPLIKEWRAGQEAQSTIATQQTMQEHARTDGYRVVAELCKDIKSSAAALQVAAEAQRLAAEATDDAAQQLVDAHRDMCCKKVN